MPSMATTITCWSTGTMPTRSMRRCTMGLAARIEYADRQAMARGHDGLVEAKGPDTVLIHLKATPEVVRQRMAAGRTCAAS